MSTPFQALTPQRVDSPIYRLGGICDSAAANLLSVFTGFALIPIRLGATYQEIRGQPVGLPHLDRQEGLVALGVKLRKQSVA